MTAPPPPPLTTPAADWRTRRRDRVARLLADLPVTLLTGPRQFRPVTDASRPPVVPPIAGSLARLPTVASGIDALLIPEPETTVARQPPPDVNPDPEEGSARRPQPAPDLYPATLPASVLDAATADPVPAHDRRIVADPGPCGTLDRPADGPVPSALSAPPAPAGPSDRPAVDRAAEIGLAPAAVRALFSEIAQGWEIPAGDLQDRVDTVPDSGTLPIEPGVANGTTILDRAITLEGDVRGGSWLLGGEQPAIIIDAPGGAVTLRGLTIGSSTRRGTVLIVAGDVSIEDCRIAGAIGIVVAEGAGDVLVIDTTVSCPPAGCGILLDSSAAVCLESVTIGTAGGLGVLHTERANLDAATLTTGGEGVVPRQ